MASAANSRWRRRAVRWVPSESRIGTSARCAYSQPKPTATSDDEDAAHEQHGEQRLQRLDLGRAVLEDLEEVGVAVLLRRDA